MSLAKVHYVQHARQTYDKVAKTDEEGRQVVTAVTSKRTGEQKVSRRGRPITRRIRVSDKSKPRALLVCENDGTVINIGDPYRWYSVGFRSSYKRVRCMKSTCTPRQSTLESSGPRSEIYGAIESANDALDALDAGSITSADVESIVQEVADAFESARDQWREADENFGGGGNTENVERADTAESSYDELSGWTTSGNDEPDYDDCDDTDQLHTPIAERDNPDDDSEVLERGDMACDECAKIRDDWFEEIIAEAHDAIDSAEIP